MLRWARTERLSSGSNEKVKVVKYMDSKHGAGDRRLFILYNIVSNLSHSTN